MVKKRTILSRQEREEQILKVAARVFATKGYRHTSVTDIVEEAGVARGTFYHYFNSKKDIFLRLVDLYFHNISNLMHQSGKRLREGIEAGEPPLLLWYDQALEYLRFHRENPHLSVSVLQEAMGTDPQFSERVAELSRAVRMHLSEDLRLLHRMGLIIKVDFDLAATFIMGTSVAAVLNHVMPDPRCDLERIAFEQVRNHSRALAVSQAAVDAALAEMESILMDRERDRVSVEAQKGRPCPIADEEKP